MARTKKQKFVAEDLVRHKAANTPYGISDMGVGIVTRVSTTGNVYVMFSMWEKPRAMHPSNLKVIR
jgi:hypothetical protein